MSVLVTQASAEDLSQQAINGALASDGRTLVLWSGAAVAFVDLETREVIGAGGRPPVGFGLFDGRFVSFDVPRLVRIWDPRTRQITKIGPMIESVDKLRIATGTAWVWTGDHGTAQPQTIGVWDIASNRKRGEFPSPVGAYGERIRDDGNVMAIVSQVQGIRLLDWTGRDIGGLPPASGPGLDIAWQPRGRALAIGDQHGMADVWYPERGVRLRLERKVEEGYYLPTDPRWSADGRRVAVFVGSHHAIRVHDGADGHEIPGPMVFPPPGMWGTIFAPLGTRGVGFGSVGGSMAPPQHLVLWDTATGDVIARIPGSHFAHVFSPDGALLGVLERDRHVRVYSVRDGTLVRDFPEKVEGKPMFSLLAAPHHAFLSFCNGASVGLWDAESGVGNPHFVGRSELAPDPAPAHSGP